MGNGCTDHPEMGLHIRYTSSGPSGERVDRTWYRQQP